MSTLASTLAELAEQRRQEARQRARRPSLAAAKPDRYARWHIPETGDRESEEWLLTYLDMLTLLLAMLVVLLGMSQLGWSRRGDAPPQLVGSVAKHGLPADGNLSAHLDSVDIPAAWALLPLPGELPPRHPADVGPLPRAAMAAWRAGDIPPASGHTAPGAAPGPAPSVPMVPRMSPPSAEELGLSDLGKDVDVIINDQSISFRISNELLFPSGQSMLSPAGLDIVRRLAKVVNRSRHALSVEGHSDNIPIQTRQFPSNWELSTSRATSVLRQLERDGVDPARLRAIGYADTRPIASNDSADGRARNRRVELILQISPEPAETAGTASSTPPPDPDRAAMRDRR